MIYMESIRGYPYRKKEDLAAEFSICKSTVNNRLKEIEEEIRRGRYDDYAIIRDGKLVLVNVLVFIDYLTYRKLLINKNARKYAPAYRPEKLIRSLGWNSRAAGMDEEGSEVV